jgi:predicted  nucleic acid-binding Zn-ribbon protein
MKRFLKLYRNADLETGGADIETTDTETATADTQTDNNDSTESTSGDWIMSKSEYDAENLKVEEASRKGETYFSSDEQVAAMERGEAEGWRNEESTANTPPAAYSQTPEGAKPEQSVDPVGGDQEGYTMPEGTAMTWDDNQVAGVQQAMTRLGAKNPTELAEKLKGLQSQVGKSGQELGHFRQQSEEYAAQNNKYQQDLARQDQFIRDLTNGVPSAYEHLRRINPNSPLLNQAAPQHPVASQPGHPAASTTPQPAASAPPGFIPEGMPEDVMDEDGYNHITGYMKQMNEKHNAQMQTMQNELRVYREQLGNVSNFQNDARQRTEETQNRNAAVDSIMAIVEQHPDHYKPQHGNVRDMANQYFTAGSEQSDPRFDAVSGLLEYSQVNKIWNLEQAHRLYTYDKTMQGQQAAVAQGRQEVLNQPRTVGLGMKTANGSSPTSKAYTPAEVDAIMKDISRWDPKWTDTNGDLDKAHLPKEFWEVAGIRE